LAVYDRLFAVSHRLSIRLHRYLVSFIPSALPVTAAPPAPTDDQVLAALYREHFGGPPPAIVPLRAHGSDRRIFRLRSADRAVIGVVHGDTNENAAFLSFARHFRSCALPVPEVFAVSGDGTAYLETDLGDTTLFDLVGRGRAAGGTGISSQAATVYEQVVQILPEFQVRASRGLDFSKCHPRGTFDRQSMLWDLNYFKYYFLKLAHIPFHEQDLENDFEALAAYLLQAPAGFFLYRDFQSRNVMVGDDGTPWFIDFQGGRRGPLQYDLASLLVDAKANLPLAFREHLTDVYLRALVAHIPVDRSGFLAFHDGFALIRILQAMGAYGFRGFFERKAHFLQSVPYAIRNLEALLGAWRLPVPLPALGDTLRRIVRSTRLREVAAVAVPLTVRVESFSYKRGLPADDSGHGGGFVFDCRALPNPGREPHLAPFAGDDAPVVAWLEAQSEVHTYLARVRDLVAQAVESYRRRNFTHLSVAFGCTGGQHRSVYCATQFALHLRALDGVQVDLRHRDVVRPPRPSGSSLPPA
jgi:aminoglycoside/choline kinase family phosphotransferase